MMNAEDFCGLVEVLWERKGLRESFIVVLRGVHLEDGGGDGSIVWVW